MGLAPVQAPRRHDHQLPCRRTRFRHDQGTQLGKSREIRLRIVSKEDAARQFDDARRELREELAGVLTMQKQAITPVDERGSHLSQTDRLPRSSATTSTTRDDPAPGDQHASITATKV